MSRTKHSWGGHWDKSWWGKRPLAWHTISENSGENKWWKRLLHKIERRQAKKIINNEQEI